MKITIETTVNAPMEKVWMAWTNPDDITKWNFASPDWICPRASNDLKVGGKFNSRMEARDGSMGFDFEGTYTQVENHKFIEYRMEDDRKVQVAFEQKPDGVKVTETFDTEDENSAEMQKNGWQAILNNFKTHVESK